jgi:hypothetical protein
MAAQKNFHKIFTFEQARGFFQVLLGALPISDYARASFFVQRNRVTFDQAVWFFENACTRQPAMVSQLNRGNPGF